LDFFESLPLVLEFDDLLFTHATWHLGCIAQLRDALGVESAEHRVHDRWRSHVALHAAFEGGALRQGVPTEIFEDQWEKSLEIFVKGYESPADEPFVDNDGTLSDKVRTQWWRPEHD
jgi:hypothetical protein